MLALYLAATAQAADPFAHPATGKALQATLSRPAAQLSTAQVLQGRFTHSKHLREIPKPLVATGEFVFARDLGVYWHTRQPFDSVVVLTERGILEQNEGSQSLNLSADEQPAVRMIARVFLAMFTLDLARLEQTFELFSVTEGARWTLGLKPRSRALANVFVQATVTGSTEVEQVVLTDANGDRTVIDLAGIEYSNAAPSAAIRALFAPAKP